MPKPKIRNVGIVIKQKVAAANDLAQELAGFLKEKGIEVSFASESKDVCAAVTGTECASKEDLVKTCDIILVLGGDGTFISVARLMRDRSIPIMGINMGTLGFLTEVKKGEAKDTIQKALNHECRISSRILLEASLIRGGKEIDRQIIVNDAVVTKAAIARIIDMQVAINGNPLTTMRADGLIISTPAGSTAYSLAAGGPVIEPSVPALAITPICPHSLTLRPLVVDDYSVISVTLSSNSEAVVTWDGQASHELTPGDTVQVKKYDKHMVQVIRTPERNYFGLLREKLKYGYRD